MPLFFLFCLSAAFTREGMPVSTFSRLFPPSNPFSVSLAILLGCFVAKSRWGVDFLELILGCFGWGGLVLGKVKRRLGAGLYPSLMKCPNFVVK